MKGEGFKGLVGDAVKLNMSYYGALLDVTTDYLKALKGLAEAAAANSARPVATRPAASPAPPRPATAPPVPPLVLAAEAGKAAEANFAVTNSTPEEVGADIEISKELSEAGVTAEPAGMMMAPGQQVVFKLVGRPGKMLDPARDVHGHVSVPRLGDRAIPVVLRRLPDPPKAAAKPVARKTAAKKAATTRKPKAKS